MDQLEGSWESYLVYLCVVDLEKACDHPLAYLVGGIAGAWKEAIQSLDNQSESYDCDLIKKSKAFSVGVGPHRNSVRCLGAGRDIPVGLQP